MRQFGLIFVFLVLSLFSSAQKKQVKPVNVYEAIDQKALQIPDSLTHSTDDIAAYIKNNFTTETEKSRAVFIWIATNIQYDFENMFALNFYEKEEEKINKPLKTHKGICENYAALFNDICNKAGIKSYVVEGYTKQNGFTDYIPHAWNAAHIDSSWYLFDATWGSGYISNQKFVRRIDNDYFKASPEVRIKSHMPFDYLWQFLNYPITNQEFYEGNVKQNTSKPYFSYADSIKAWEVQPEAERLSATFARVEKNGVKNSMIFDRLEHLKMQFENIKISRYNSATDIYNDGVNKFNDFIQYRNKQFSPKKSDVEIKSMIDGADEKVKESQAILHDIKDPPANVVSAMVKLSKGLDDLSTHITEQQDWLKLYLSKSKVGRKSMFYKYTWMGIPLN
jgi:transglutaminase/protease-like cytokinesis protein 3